VCFVDYDRQLVLVAERGADATGRGADATGRGADATGRGASASQPTPGAPAILGVARLSRLPWKDEAEFALLVSDQFQRQGLGTELLRRLLQVARRERIRRVVGFISPENQPMLQIARRLGFKLQRPKDDPTMVEATIDVA
jgi:acetyltransferase